MSDRGKFSPVLQQVIDDPDGTLRALRRDSAAFERSMLMTEGGLHQAGAALPNRNAMGFLLFDNNGEPFPLDGTPDWLPKFLNLDDLLSCVDRRGADGRLIQVDAEGGLPLFGLWAPFGETSGWNLPAGLRSSAARLPGCYVAMFVGGVFQPLDAAVAGFALSPLQQRVVTMVVRTGGVRAASARLGISYATAREAMASACRRLHLPNTPAMVRTVVAAGFGIIPGDVEAPVQLADMLCISERQARVALLVSSGLSREAAARAIGTSKSVVKKEMQLLFSSFGLQSASELARLITEVHALRTFAREIDNPPGFLDPAIEPSRFAIRPNGRGSIAWSDYGPASGRPVLIVHSNWSCRAVPLPLLVELQRRGWRPIAIDRPGFGATHIGASTRDDPFSQAIADAVQLLDMLRMRSIPIIARCGAQFVHALKSAVPDRVGSVVLVSPTPEASDKGKRMGAVGAFKEAFYRSPLLVEMYFRVICAQFSYERVNNMMLSLAKGCPADEALCENPQFIRDRFRALRPFACGNYIGGIFEELIISHGGREFAPLDVQNWIILQGADDPHNSFEEVHTYWSSILPQTPIEAIPSAGRFMTSSHPSVVVDRLEQLAEFSRIKS